MNVPAQIALGPHTYEIRSDHETSTLLREDGKAGDSLRARLIIRVDAEVPHTSVAETLLHETLHCIWDLTPLRDASDDEEERIVSALAPYLLDVLRRNPKLVTYLTAKENA